MRSKKKNPLIPLLIVLFILMVGGLTGWYIYSENIYKQHISEKAGTGNTPYVIEIEKGMAVGAIAKTLDDKKLIVDRDAFVRYAKEKGDDRQMHAGTFSVTSGLTIPEVLDILTGRVAPARTRITVKEGLTIRDIAGLLVQQGLITNQQELYDCIATTCDFSAYTFLPPKQNAKYAFPYSYMEGYLFPDTYFVDTADFSPQSFVTQMLKTFDTRVRQGLAKDIAASDHSLQEIVTMASIVEKESRPADDQAIVAGVLWKRIDNNVQLAADATNRYIMEDPKEAITMKQLLSNDPYNSRKVHGLPPSAISNPGLASFKAAMKPKTSDWWYYLHDSNGVIHFARTENEHEQNKSQFLQ